MKEGSLAHRTTSKHQLPGVYTALVTPFHTDGSLDYGALERLIQRQVQARVKCITLLGSTGEGATVPLHERRELLKKARKMIPSTTLFFSGCGTSSTHETIQQIEAAEGAGCDGLQIVTPPYNKPSQEGLYSHFKTIHDSTALDIFLYNIPGRSACAIELDTMKRLFELKNIKGVKEATGSMPILMDVLEAREQFLGKITVLIGDDVLALPAIALGADGVMSVVSNIAPKMMIELTDAALNGDLKTAQTLHFKLKPLVQACFFETNPTPTKYILSKMGHIHNSCRLPLVPVSRLTENKIDTLIEQDPFIHELLSKESLDAETRAVMSGSGV